MRVILTLSLYRSIILGWGGDGELSYKDLATPSLLALRVTLIDLRGVSTQPKGHSTKTVFITLYTRRNTVK